MPAIIRDNHRMRWGRPKRQQAVPAGLSRLDRERAQLEQLISTTGNKSIAEMARIKLRVVNFVRTTSPVDEKGSAANSADANEPLPPIELPRSVSVAPVTHLIDLTQQRVGLEQIQQSAPKIALPIRHPVAQHQVEFVEHFMGTSSGVAKAVLKTFRAIVITCLWLCLLSSFFALAYLGIRDAQESSQFNVVALGALAPWILLVLLGVVRGRWFVSLMCVTNVGVHIRGRFESWEKIRAITLDYADNVCVCSILTRDGKRYEQTLDDFTPDLMNWRLRLLQTVQSFDSMIEVLELGQIPTAATIASPVTTSSATINETP